jgi:hypothetical protein
MIILAVIVVIVLVSVAVWAPWPSPIRCAACHEKIHDGDGVVTDIDSGKVAHLSCPAARGSR